MVINFDRNLARNHPANQTFVIDHRPAFMLDEDSQTYWSAPPGSRSSVVMLELDKYTEHITYTKVEWNFKPEYFALK